MANSSNPRRKERRSRIAMIDDPADSKLTIPQLLIAFAILLIVVSFGIKFFST
jgi:hypothetical protein